VGGLIVVEQRQHFAIHVGGLPRWWHTSAPRRC
jgi:hypothetical protein